MKRRARTAICVGAVAFVGALGLAPEADAARQVTNAAKKADRLPGVKLPPLPQRRPMRMDAADQPARATAMEADNADEDKTASAWPKSLLEQGRENCIALLTNKKIEFDWMPPIRRDRCGDPAPIRLRAVGSTSRVVISPPASVNCNMAAKLHNWVDSRLQPLAQRHLGSRVTAISNISSYSCRNRYGRKKGRLSEHALANAIDVAAFALADGRTVDLLTHWGKTRRALIAERKAAAKLVLATKAQSKNNAKAVPQRKGQPAFKRIASTSDVVPASQVLASGDRQRVLANGFQTQVTVKGKRPGKSVVSASSAGPALATLQPRPPKAQFLRDTFKAACDVFGTVLGPEANKAHENHFHFDLAPRRRKAYCE